VFDLFGRARLRELESTLREEESFKVRFQRELAAYVVMRNGIFVEHPAKSFPSRDGVHLELRCVRCHTDEHHTWYSDNFLIWPCPTVKLILAIQETENA